MPYSLEKVKILILDDMKPMLALTSSVLENFGFKNVYTADNADSAYELLRKNDPDLIITDWLMEPMDGLEFTKMVRRNSLTPNPYVPILMMTGFSSRLRVEKARDMGITEFLVKPFSAKDLYNRIVQIIERPRQFVETGAFFGPDRRRKMLRDYDGPRRRDDDSSAQQSSDSSSDQKIADILKKLREEAKIISDKPAS